MRKPVVAVSGGVDSMTLAVVTHLAHGSRTRILHAVSPAVPPDATARVHAYAAREGWRLEVLDAGEMGDARYLANPVNRCYFCKTNLYEAMGRRTSGTLLSGTNLDDLGDYRPGLIAAKEHHVRHPYVEASIDKEACAPLRLARARRSRRAGPRHPACRVGWRPGYASKPAFSKPSTIARRRCARCSPRAPFGAACAATESKCSSHAGTLERLDEVTKRVGADHVTRRFAQSGCPLPVAFSAYRRGSAFVHRTRDE